MSGSDDGLADGEAEPLGEAEGLAAVFAATVMDDWKAVASCSLVKHSSWVPSASSTQASEAWLVDLQVVERRLRFGLVGAAAVVHAGVVDEAVLLLLTLLDRAVREAGDLHLDRVAREHDVGLPHPEGVDPVPDVGERLVHDVARRALGRREDHRDAALEVQAQGGLQGTGGEADQGPHDEQGHHDDREPQAAGSLHASSEPFTTSRNRASSISAARRHSCILPRKISKYSITWLIWVSMVSSRLTVRASESTRRNDCSTA